MAKRRRRGVVLTPEGLQKFRDVRLKHETEHNWGDRYTYEKLSELTCLDINTIKRVIKGEDGVDKRTLEQLYQSFELELTENCFSKPNPHRRQNWGEAMCVDNFYGRTEELSDLESLLLRDHCRIITMLGMGGMGKTCLSVKLAEQVQERFDLVIWCSLRDAPPIKEVLGNIIEFFSDGKETPGDLPQSIKQQVSLLIKYLREFRCLIILDNLEGMLCSGQRAGQFREGYEEYGEMLLRIGQSSHQSSLILTTREKPQQVAFLEGEELPVRTFRLNGLAEDAGEQILRKKGLTGDEEEYKALVNHYDGNALALKVVATTVRDLFEGNVSEFLEHETAIFGDIRDLLRQQFERLSNVEKEIVYWLAINREPLTIVDVREDMVTDIPKLALLEGLESLTRRSLVERDTKRFTLQNVVMEYVICRFVERLCQEIITLELNLFRFHSVIKATAKDYVRETQIRLILEPIIEGLMIFFKSRQKIEKRLNEVLTLLRQDFASESCYAAGNILNMLCHMETDFTGYDFSDLAVWQADFRNSCFHDVNFSNADLSKSVFVETFGGVLSVAFSPDGKLLAKGDMNGEIRLYRVSDWQQISSFKGHDDWVMSIAFTPDSSIVATSSIDQTIKFWNVNTGECLQTLSEHSNGIGSVAFSSDGQILASGSDDKTIKFWDVDTGKCLQTLHEHDGEIRSIKFTSNSQMLISGSVDKTLKIWDVDTGECLQTLQGHNDVIWSVDVSQDDQYIVSASSDKTIRLWNLNTGECIRILEGHQDLVWSVAFSLNGQYISSSSWDQNVKLWNASTGECLKTFSGHERLVRAVAFSVDSKMLASGSDDQSLKLWSVERKSCLRTLKGYGNSIWSVSLCPRGEILASSGDSKSVRLWNIKTGKCLNTFESHNNTIREVTFSSDGQILASCSDDQTIKIWDRKTGQLLNNLQGHDGWVWSVVFSPDGQMLATGSHDQTLKLWDVSTGQCLRTLAEKDHGILSVVFNPDGKLLATSSTDQTVKIWDVKTSKCLKTLQGHEGWIWSITSSPDGKILSSACTDGTVKLWDIRTGECLKTLQGHEGWVWSTAFSPSGQVIASGSTDRTVKLWNVNTGECFKTLEGHKSGILSVIFDNKGHHVISSSEDETIRFWDVQTGECTKILRGKKPYEGMIVNNAYGLTEAKITILKTLGAVRLSHDRALV